MKIDKNIRNFVKNYPLISNIGYTYIKEWWKLKANFINYKYPNNPEFASVPQNLIINFNKNRPYGPKQKICYAPFNNLHFQINGNVSACSFNYDFIIGNINKNTIKEIWFGEKANEFRNKLSNYNFEMCKSCENVLKSKNYNSFPPLKYDMYADNDMNFPTQMSFEMSDLCNFECIMCNENFSSLIRKRKGIPQQNFSYPDNFFDELNEFIPHLKIATFIGGEPLLIKPYFKIWEEIIKQNPSCAIHTQTNASFIPPRFLELLQSGQFEIGISLDATNKEIFEKIRINSNFDVVEKNILILKSLMDKNLVTLNINFCPLVINWKELPEMVKYANKLDIPLKIVNVENPRNLSLQHRDFEYINEVITNLEKHQFSNSQNIIHKKNIESYYQFIKHLKYLLKEAKNRNEVFIEIVNNLDFKFKQLFQESSLFNNFTDEQRIELYESISKYINELPTIDVIKEKIKFRIYFSLYKFKHTNNGNASTDFNYGYSILENVAFEFYLLENEINI
jgi:MoaA/NifB/PqqE/SkfB family radical SAM enzyme